MAVDSSLEDDHRRGEDEGIRVRQCLLGLQATMRYRHMDNIFILLCLENEMPFLAKVSAQDLSVSTTSAKDAIGCS